MKRITALLTALILVCSMTACGSNNTPAPTQAPTTEAPTTEALTTEPAETGTDAQEAPAQKFLADFKAQVSTGNLTMEELATALVTNDWVPFGGAAMAVEPGYLNGFSNEITGFAEGASFGPMIGSIPFIGYVFRLENAADADAFMKTLKENADLRWNICTQADEMVCEAVDNTVFFVMSPASFDD